MAWEELFPFADKKSLKAARLVGLREHPQVGACPVRAALSRPQPWGRRWPWPQLRTHVRRQRHGPPCALQCGGDLHGRQRPAACLRPWPMLAGQRNLPAVSLAGTRQGALLPARAEHRARMMGLTHLATHQNPHPTPTPFRPWPTCAAETRPSMPACWQRWWRWT